MAAEAEAAVVATAAAAVAVAVAETVTAAIAVDKRHQARGEMHDKRWRKVAADRDHRW